MADEDERWLYGDSNPDEEEPGKDETTNEQPSQDTLKAAVKNLDLKPPEIRNEEEEEKMEVDKDAIEEKSKNDSNRENENENGNIKEESESMDATDDAGKKENGEIEDDEKGEENEEEEEDEEDEDDSDEDNVNVIIGDINKSGPTYTNINIPKRGPNITGPGVKSAGKFSIEDFESVGVINGVPAHEFNVDVIEDKPWRIPGADITDYFNYGFNEDTWKAYCERQKRIRIHESCTGLPTQTLAGQSWTNSQSSQNTQYGNTQAPGAKKTGWETGQIRVIGAGVASRRVDESGPESQNISVLPPSNNFAGIPPPNMMPPLIPPMEMPPPGFPASADPYGPPPATNEYFNPEPDYFSSYEPTAADQWRDGWTPGNLVTFGQNVNPNVLSHLEESNSQDRLLKEREKSRDRDRDSDRDRSRDRERSRDRDRERERTLEREEKDKRKERSHRNRSRSKSHERKRKSRSRSPGHKKHKKKSKKSDRKKRSDDTE